jgi:hypothetical protein
MTPEWVTTAATVFTALVIAASAAAALVQLRHMRGSNQIVALTECRETLESPEFRDAQRFVSYELPKRLSDPVEARRITEVPFADEYQSITTVANFFENMGLFVKTGIIDKRIACDAWSLVVLRNWEALLPVTSFLRHRTNDRALWENFEYMAALSERYQRDHPTSYPSGMERMPENRSLIELAKSWE